MYIVSFVLDMGFSLLWFFFLYLVLLLEAHEGQSILEVVFQHGNAGMRVSERRRERPN